MEYDYKFLTKALRTKLILSQEELAKILNVSFASVNRWETGKNSPTIKAKRKIVELCIQYGIMHADDKGSIYYEHE